MVDDAASSAPTEPLITGASTSAVPSPVPQSDATPSNHRKTPRPNYSPEEDRVIILETASTKAFRKPALFDLVATTLNKSECCLGVTTGRGVKERFARILRSWRTNDGKLRGMSGVSESVNEIDGILAGIDAEMKDVEDERRAAQEAEAKRKLDMQRVDENVLEMAEQRRGQRRSLSSSEDEENAEKDAYSPKVKKKRRSGNEFELVIDAMREADQAAKEREAQRLEFEREERDKDRAVRSDELKMVVDAVLACLSALKK